MCVDRTKRKTTEEKKTERKIQVSAIVFPYTFSSKKMKKKKETAVHDFTSHQS